MDLSNLSSGLFGYKKMAVTNYISSLESEYNQKIQDLQKESKETQESLRRQLDAEREKHEEEIKRLQEKIDDLTYEKDLHHRDNATIADTLLDAQEYATDLRNKADEKAAIRDKEHMHMLSVQQNKVQEIDTKLRNVLGEISALLQTAADQLNEKEEVLNETEQIIEEEKALYGPTEAEEAACGGDAQEAEAEQEEASEETAEFVQDKLEETAESADAEVLAESAEAAAEAVVPAQEEGIDLGATHEEAVSRFTLAAGEIAEKAAVRSE